jgi:hypothetical protein
MDQHARGVDHGPDPGRPQALETFADSGNDRLVCGDRFLLRPE